MTSWVDYGDKVRVLREARGWSQAELGVHAGTSQANIRDVERGEYKNGPHPDTVAGIQRAFGPNPGEDGYHLTADHISPVRADNIAGDGNDALLRMVQAVPKDRREALVEIIRDFVETGPSDPSV